MTSECVNKRPNCEVILEMKNDFSLNASDFVNKDSLDELWKLFNTTKLKDKRLIIAFIARKINEDLAKSNVFILDFERIL
jgi:hypothetical protein